MEGNEEKKLQRTDLLWDKYIDYLIKEVRQSKFMKRSKDKPMFAASHVQEPHRTTRIEHSEMAADISKRIAKGLNLNYEFIYAAMLGHDAGHPFSAHDGEEMFNGEGILNNIQYFHHNAEGVKIYEMEHIMENAIASIPNIESLPDVKKQLIEEFPYFLDVIISHDGEATPQEMYRGAEQYPNIKTAVDTKLRLATANSGKYKFTAQTPEGQIAKFADVIAYLATDIQDRFRSGIHTDFPKEYLELFGDIFAESYVSGGKEEKIQIAKNKIEAIEKQYIMQNVYKTEKNEKIINKAEEITQEILKENIDINNQEVINDIIEKRLNAEYTDLLNNADIEEKKKINSERTKLKRCIGNFIHARTGVIREVTNMMQEYFISDLLKNSKNSSYIHFSESVEDIFFKAKKINYKYVPEAKWHYLDEEQPIAVHELVNFLAISLRRTGVIENMFYDESIREQLKDEPEALKYMRTNNIEDQQYERFKKHFGIEDVRTTNKKYAGGEKEQFLALKELFAAAYTYSQDNESTFAQQYLNTFYAIENQVTCKVDSILGNLTKKDKKARKTHIKYYDEMIEKDEAQLKKYIEEEYGDISTIDEEKRKKIIEDIVTIQRLFMEDKMAKQIAITYLSGQTDTGIMKLARDTGFIGTDIFNEKKRGVGSKEKLNELSKSMIMPSDNGEER